MNSDKSAIQTGTNSSLTIRLDFRTAMWISLFVFVLFTRFHHLGEKPFHHDESLYAKYMWNFHVGQGYQYDPMQHGPFMFHMEQIPLFLFGVNNYSVRILSATTGFVLILSLFLIRRRLPDGVALLAGWIFGINPVFMYFQRFLRHDPFFSLFSILVILFSILWFQDRKPWQAYAFSASLAALYCIKENAFINILIMFTFVLFKVFADMFDTESDKRLGLSAFPRNMNAFPMVSKVMMFVALWGVSFVVYAIGNQWFKSRFDNWDKTVHYYWVAAFMVYFIFTAFLVVRGEKARTKDGEKPFFGMKPEFFSDSYIFALSLLIFIGIFILLYTTFFTNLKGFWGGIYKWYTYWLHQHSIARIRGPFHYYHHQILIYAFLAGSVSFIGLIARTMRKAGYILSSVYIVLFIAGVLFARSATSPWPLTKEDLFTNEHLVFAIGIFIAGAYCVFTYLREKSYLKAFLAWWTLLAYLIYSYLQEKVPWLTMHIVTPMILLTAVYLMEIFRNREERWKRNSMIALFGVMVLYTLHTSFMLCWYHEADPTEQMVYVQTTYDVPKIINEMKQIAYWTNQEKSIPMVINGNATWPFYWYLRDWKKVTYGKHVDPNRDFIVICDWEERHQFREKLGDKYVARRYGLRAWYLPTRKDLTTGNTLRNAWRWIMYRERFKPSLYGTQDICMFVRKDVAKLAWSVDLGYKPQKPKHKPEPPKKKVINPPSILQFGRFGSSNGLFNEPKDLVADSGGNIYVVDSKNNRIQKFSPDGKFLKAWGVKGKNDGQFDKPTGIGIDSSNNIYVADTWNHRIQKFSPDGKFIMKFGDSSMFWAPKDVYVDDEGFIYVVNTGFHKIHKFTRSGHQVWAVGSKGAGSTEFTEPVGITMDKSGRLYVTDTGNQRVCVYDRDGHLLKTFPVYGWEFYYTEPFISYDAQKNLLVISDSRNNRLEVFNLSGTLQAFWGREGMSSGAFKAPIGVCVGNGKIYVSDSMNHRVQVFKGDIF